MNCRVLIVVLLVVGCVATLVVCGVLGEYVFIATSPPVAEAQWTEAQERINRVNDAVTAYCMAAQHTPDSLDDVELRSRVKLPLDPFSGGPFTYRKIDSAQWSLECLGADGVPGGVGTNRDIMVSGSLDDAR